MCAKIQSPWNIVWSSQLPALRPGLEGSPAPPTVSRVALVVAESSSCSFFPASTALRCFRTSLWATQWNRRTKMPWREMGFQVNVTLRVLMLLHQAPGCLPRKAQLKAVWQHLV